MPDLTVYRGRFAPSPTGSLHFGSLVAAVASYADALLHRGEWLIRIEDVDEARSDPGAAEQIVATLALYGFPTSAEIMIQSRRTDAYREALVKLQADGHVFPCSCSRSQLADASMGRLGERIYPGYCRAGPRKSAGPHAWRVRVDDRPIVFVDRLQGLQRQVLAEDVGDFVVLRADGFFAYQLAVVVDDAAQGINAVVRGADLLASTARQILLQQLMALPSPSYMHVPVALNDQGEKLSKQTRAPGVSRDDPVGELLRVWAFLDQAPPLQTLRSTSDFWTFAALRWEPKRLPPVPMLPART